MTQHTEHKSAGEVLGDVFSQAKDGIASFGETIAKQIQEMFDNAS
jgi:hypothetical protein